MTSPRSLRLGYRLAGMTNGGCAGLGREKYSRQNANRAGDDTIAIAVVSSPICIVVSGLSVTAAGQCGSPFPLGSPVFAKFAQ